MTGPTVMAPPTPPAPPRRRRWVGPTITVAMVLLVGAAAVVVVPGIVTELTPTVSDEDRRMRVSDGKSEAWIVVPAGWSWTPAFGDESGGVVGSPDRAMTVDFSLSSTTDPRTAIEEVAPGPVGDINREILADGAATEEVAYARVDDRDVVVGAITEGPVVLTFVSTPSPAYDAELARLLADIEVTR
ncbi:hypothetical protein AB3M89_10900 [Microbacterium sp. 179-I 3D2 NHS]|uniref:hypothetical protein n=1 Tax=Microbacterium sp. 179-I 3D2 NHS TaxID=3235178 RepID=UPI00399EF822